jgi:GH25 family lysozyme M1 (1,4-beta-N-acetylmuramidase)
VIEGVDVAKYQPNFMPRPGDDFMFIKATLGQTVVDPLAGRHAKVARDAGLPVGWYHFLWPSSDSGTGSQQADWFLKNIPDLRAGDLLVCDWEGTSAGLPTVADRDGFVARCLDRESKHRSGIYCTPSRWRGYNTAVSDKAFVWVAHWTSNPQPASCGRPWTFWQYSDSGNRLDLDRGNFGSRAELKDWAHSLDTSTGGNVVDPGAEDGILGMTKIEKFHYSGV